MLHIADTIVVLEVSRIESYTRIRTSVTRRNEIPSKTRSTFEVTLSAKKMEVPPEFITAKHLQTCLQMHCKYQQRIFHPFQHNPYLLR